MRLYGIIGFPLSHSFSPAYFHHKFTAEGIDARYEAFPLSSIEALPSLLAAQPELCGFNVTIPYKTAIIPYLQQLSPDATAIGAVNCVQVQNGELYGHNTDHEGFSRSLQPLLQNAGAVQALVLGTGGASRAVCYALQQLQVHYRLVSRRSPDPAILNYAQLAGMDMQDYRLIINTTPLGMYPDTDNCPDIPYEHLSEGHILYDLVYNPAQTLFLQKGAAQGAVIKNGADMLQIQAELGWAIWNRD